MCGIAGIWGTTNDTALHQMIDLQRHRGPDGQGIHQQMNQGMLGHVRLAIMDPAYGSQPIYNKNRSMTIVANGMVYNHSQLRSSLLEKHEFHSGSDSETILHVFEECGLSTPLLLDGMFAFAISSKDRLILARDRIGIKPLYYGKQSNGELSDIMYFASEIKALPSVAEDIKEFPPGTLYDSSSGFHQYYQVPEQAPIQLDIETHIHRVRETIEAAVKKRLLSDVPLGAFLSGGLDSSIIAAIARKYTDELHTFSVGIEGSRDIEAARKVARHIGSTHHEYIYTAEEVIKHLPEIIYHLESFDQDLVRSAIPTWFCARLAAENVKVILTGEGADELFAGYAYHKEFANYDALHKELQRSVTRLHNINLQRVDRMTMSHAIEARVPFLDTEVIALAQTVPSEYKLYAQNGGQLVEKWVLRKAFEDLLPQDIVWRNKEQFDEGSGMVDLLPVVLQQAAEIKNVEEYMKNYKSDRLRSREECFYHQLLVSHFHQPHAVLNNVGRWQLR